MEGADDERGEDSDGVQAVEIFVSMVVQLLLARFEVILVLSTELI